MALSKITTASLSDDSVDTAQIADDAIESAQLANNVAISTSGAITTTGAFTSVGIDDNADAVAILTEWNEFRAMNLYKLKSLLNSPIVLDTRNLLSPEKLKELNFTYDNVGRKFIQ